MVNKTKKIVQDIIVKNKTSSSVALKKILEKNTRPFSSAENKFKKKKPASQKIPPKQKTISQKRKPKSKRKLKGKFVFNLIVIFVVIILVTKVVDVYSHAIIQIVPHQETAVVDVILKSDKSDSADLPHETMELNLVEQVTIRASGVETVESKASGKIVVYNAFSSRAQTLIANTRFETPDGKIYRINKPISIPGAKVTDGKITPSSIEVTVYADKPGEAYNIGMSDFTIPGFKDSPRYDKFYGRSKTPIEGGYKGERPVVSEEDFENVKKTLEDDITEKLLVIAREQLPKNFLMFDGATDISFDVDNSNIVSEYEEQQNFTLTERGSLFAIIIPQKNLSEILVEKYLGIEFKNKTKVINFDELNFSVINLNTEKKSMIFKVEGEVKFSWLVNEDTLKEALMASKKDMQSVFEEYPEIEKATILFKPSWWRFFPDKINRVSIEQLTSEG
ncbi:hypothetical protein ACFLY5_01080 [Patescibacteria group bacterium]